MLTIFRVTEKYFELPCLQGNKPGQVGRELVAARMMQF